MLWLQQTSLIQKTPLKFAGTRILRHVITGLIINSSTSNHWIFAVENGPNGLLKKLFTPKILICTINQKFMDDCAYILQLLEIGLTGLKYMFGRMMVYKHFMQNPATKCIVYAKAKLKN